MNDNYYEIGTIGSTPIYEKVKAKKRNIGKLYTQADLDTAVADHDTQAFAMLSILGVPIERAHTVANGIEVLSTRYRKEQAGYEYNLQAAVGTLEDENKRLKYLISPDAPKKYFDDLLDNLSKQDAVTKEREECIEDINLIKDIPAWMILLCEKIIRKRGEG